MLTGRYRSPEDFPADDFRRGIPQFQGENFKINLEIVDKLVSRSGENSTMARWIRLADDRNGVCGV